MLQTEFVILVDQNDKAIGKEEKLIAHREKKLHRAFSIFVFFHNGQSYELLLQQRSKLKYHSGGLWTNTCCGHPAPNQETDQAAQLRLKKEIGIDLALIKIGVFHYQAKLDHNMFENEIDHVFVGITKSKQIKINQAEIMAYKWQNIISLQKDLQHNPDQYTVWFESAFKLVNDSKLWK